MKTQPTSTHKDFISWVLVLAWALTGFFLFLKKSPPEISPSPTSYLNISLSALPFFATIALTAFFLLIRHIISQRKSVPPTRFKHIAGAILLAVGGIISWEFSQMFLITRPFSFNLLVGVFGGSIMVICCWLLLKILPISNQ